MKKYIALLFIVFSIFALSSCSLENKKQTFDELQSSVNSFKETFSTKDVFYKEASCDIKRDTDKLTTKYTLLCDKNYNTIEVINGYNNDSNSGYIKNGDEPYNYYSYKKINNSTYYEKKQTEILHLYLEDLSDQIFNIDYDLNKIKITKNANTYEITSSVDNLCCEEVKTLIKDIYSNAYNVYQVKRYITITDSHINSSYQLALQGQTNIGKNQFTITYIYQFSDNSPKNFEENLLIGTDVNNPATITISDSVESYNNCIYIKNTFADGFYKLNSYNTIYCSLYDKSNNVVSTNKYGNIIKLDKSISYFSLKSYSTISINPIVSNTIREAGSYQVGTSFIISMKDNKKYVLKNNGDEAIEIKSNSINSTAKLKPHEETIIYTENIDDISTYLFCNSKESNSIEIKEYNEEEYTSQGIYLTSPQFKVSYTIKASEGKYLVDFSNTDIYSVYDVTNKHYISDLKLDSYNYIYKLNGEYIFTLQQYTSDFINTLKIEKLNEDNVNEDISLEMLNGKRYSDFKAYISGYKTSENQNIRYNFSVTEDSNSILVKSEIYINKRSYYCDIEIYDNKDNLIFTSKKLATYKVYKLTLNPGDYYISIPNVKIYGIAVYLDNGYNVDCSLDLTNIVTYTDTITNCSDTVCYFEVSEDLSFEVISEDVSCYSIYIYDISNTNIFTYGYINISLKKGTYIVYILKNTDFKYSIIKSN